MTAEALIKAALRVLDITMGMDIYVRCDAPPGSGTGSSSSISVALIGLLNQLQRVKLSPHEVAKMARTLEIRELNIGHFLIGESIFIGLDAAIRRMRAAMDQAK